MPKWTEKDTSHESGESLKDVSRAWHDARDDAEIEGWIRRGSGPGEDASERTEALSYEALAEIERRASMRQATVEVGKVAVHYVNLYRQTVRSMMKNAQHISTVDKAFDEHDDLVEYHSLATSKLDEFRSLGGKLPPCLESWGSDISEDIDVVSRFMEKIQRAKERHGRADRSAGPRQGQPAPGSRGRSTSNFKRVTFFCPKCGGRAQFIGPVWCPSCREGFPPSECPRA